MAKASPTRSNDDTEVPEWASTNDQGAPKELAGTDVEVLTGAAVAVRERNQEIVQSFVQWGLDKISGDDQDQYAVMASMFAEIMSAEDTASALATQSPVHVRDIIGRPVLVHGFELREGTYEDSQFPFYACLTVQMQGTEKTRIATTGATKVMMRLCKLDQIGEWPVFVVFTEKALKNGNTVVDMVSPDAI